jgi:two-component system, sensor histidine kinase and response regulator
VKGNRMTTQERSEAGKKQLLHRLREKIVGCLIAVSLDTDAQTRHRTITTVLFGHTLCVWAWIFALIYYFLDAPHASMTVMVAGLTGTFIVQSLKLHGSLRLTSHLLAAILLGTLLALAVSTGGMKAPAMIWLPAVPIVAILLCGSRAGLAWLLATVALATVISVLDMEGSMPPSEFQDPEAAWAYMLALLGIVTCTTLLCFVFDVNASALRRELDRARLTAEEANLAKSGFLAHMSHEIRTPMNGVIGMLELLSNTSISRRQEEYVCLARQSAEALLRVLNDILDFSKIEAGKLELESIPFQLRNVVGDTLQSMEIRATEKQLELACHIRPDVPELLSGDPGRLRQILINLVGNAIKFTHQGEIVVSVSLRDQTANHARLHFSVRDTGTGIPTHKQQRIFEAFGQADSSTTRQFGGTGLGLNISSQLIEMMGGRLALDSQEGLGTEFSFHVDFLTDAASAAVVPPPKSLRGINVLVVDDNSTNRFILKEVLSDWQMQVASANGASAALEILVQASSAGHPFQVVLLDMMMPDTDGLMLAEQIQNDSRLRGIPLILLSSSSAHEHADRHAALGIVAQLRKPVKHVELHRQILESLGLAEEKRNRPTLAHARSVRPVRILLAEDGLVNQKVATGLLALHGHHVTIANNGRLALAAWEKGTFDLILMDVEMPEMDGVETTVAIRTKELGTQQHIPIVAMTAHAIKGDRERFLESGMDAHVAKPVDPEELYDVIENLTASLPAHNLKPTPPQKTPRNINAAANEVVDWQAALGSTGGDQELLREVVDQALLEMPEIKTQLQALIREERLEPLARVAHTMKSVASVFASVKTEDAAAVIEEAAVNNDLDSVAHHLPQLLHSIDELVYTAARKCGAWRGVAGGEIV